MMPTEKLIQLQHWYIDALDYAGRFAHLPVQRRMYANDAEKARSEFKETYGVDLCIAQD